MESNFERCTFHGNEIFYGQSDDNAQRLFSTVSLHSVSFLNITSYFTNVIPRGIVMSENGEYILEPISLKSVLKKCIDSRQLSTMLSNQWAGSLILPTLALQRQQLNMNPRHLQLDFKSIRFKGKKGEGKEREFSACG